MRAVGLLPLVLLLLASGCATIDEPRQANTSFFDRLHPAQDPQHDDLIALEMALIERPIYDAYLDKDLWSVVDERLGSLASRSALQANGFKVGELGGVAPAEFMRMLTSNRSCINPRSITLRSGGSTKLVLGPALEHSRFDLVQDTSVRPTDFDKVQYELMVSATLTNDGRTCLKCTPQARHGEETTTFHPVPGGWLPRQEQQLEIFSGLTWEITVSPSQFVVVGGQMDMPESLGHECFIRAGETPPVRRLLVMRPIRAMPGLSLDLSGRNAVAPVLAIQAADSARDVSNPHY